MKRQTGFELSIEQTDRLIGLGLRPIRMEEEHGDFVAGYMLIPTKHGKWRDMDDPGWDGSYLPLLVYSDEANILVSHGREGMWQKELGDRLADILGMPVTARRR